MDFQSRSGQLLGDGSWQCCINTADSTEWPAQKSKDLTWRHGRGGGGWGGIQETFPSPRQTGRSLCRCSLCFSRGCRYMPGLPCWESTERKKEKNPFSSFTPSVALHFSPTSLSLVHSEEGIFGEAWGHSPESATELMTASLCQLWYWSRMNGLSVCIGPNPNTAQCRKSWQNWPFFPLCDSSGAGFPLQLSNTLRMNLNGYECKG